MFSEITTATILFGSIFIIPFNSCRHKYNWKSNIFISKVYTKLPYQIKQCIIRYLSLFSSRVFSHNPKNIAKQDQKSPVSQYLFFCGQYKTRCTLFVDQGLLSGFIALRLNKPGIHQKYCITCHSSFKNPTIGVQN